MKRPTNSEKIRKRSTNREIEEKAQSADKSEMEMMCLRLSKHSKESGDGLKLFSTHTQN